MKITEWTTHAKNAEIKLHRDAFLKRRKTPKLTPDTIQELAAKTVSEAHFTFVKPNAPLKRVFNLEGEDLKASIRELQLSTARDLANHIKEKHPDFFEMKNQSTNIFRTRHTLFEPKNPIAPHSDYYPAKVLGTNSNTEDLNPGEVFPDIVFFNLNPKYVEEPIDNFFKEVGVPYIKTDRIEDLESFSISGLNHEEGYIVINSDWLLAHEVKKQNSVSKRKINAIDIHPVITSSDIKVVESREYRKKESQADRDFISGKNLYFDYEFFN